ncbi:MAG: toprim domain-containing protein, partial [Microbacteriaceae bacterium]|nr:toprim domain-containing protein [Microbacteriaceae bacterium]
MADDTKHPKAPFQLTASPVSQGFDRIENRFSSERDAAASLRKAFGVGKSHNRATCPICGGKHLSVFDTAEGFRLKCYSTACDPTEIRALWCDHLGITRHTSYRATKPNTRIQRPTKPAPTKPQGDPATFVAQALAVLPKTTEITAQDVLRSYLIGRGLPSDGLDFIDTLNVHMGTTQADNVGIDGWRWSQLTHKGNALIFPCYRWNGAIFQTVYLQSLLVGLDKEGVWRKRQGWNEIEKVYLDAGDTPCYKAGSFVPLCSVEALLTAKIAYVVEGIATGCAVAVMLMMAGMCGVVICALDASNLAEVAASLPIQEIRLFADIDGTLTGQERALEAAKKAKQAGKQARVILHDTPLDTEELEAYQDWQSTPIKERKEKPPKRGIDALDLFDRGMLT